MSHGLRIHDGTGMIAEDPSLGILLAYGSTVPSGAGYAPGCRFIKTDGSTLATVNYVNVGTKASANFVSIGTAGGVVINYIYGEALALDMPFFIANRAYQVQSIVVRPLVAGTDASAVTAQIRKVGDGVAASGGSVLHTGTADLKGTININQTLTLSGSASVLLLATGNAISFDVTGVTTAARGLVTVALLPV